MRRVNHFIIGFIVGALAMAILFFFILHFGNQG